MSWELHAKDCEVYIVQLIREIAALQQEIELLHAEFIGLEVLKADNAALLECVKWSASADVTTYMFNLRSRECLTKIDHKLAEI